MRIKLTLLFLSCLSFTYAQTILSGVVLDENNEPLVAATVAIVGTTTGTVTNVDGVYRIRLQKGERKLRYSYLGYRPLEETVVVESGEEEERLDVRMEPIAYEGDEIIVYGRIVRGQVQALNQQRIAPSLRNIVHSQLFDRYPDVSLAETVQRLPGVGISRDRGEGKYVQLRGLPEQFASVAINGQRLPSVQPDAERTVGLDLIQSALIEEVRLIKALTPDMDADAIGGLVDFRLKEPKEKSELLLNAGYGYNQQESVLDSYGQSLKQGSLFFTRRYSGKFGLLFAASYNDTDRGSLLDAWRYESPETSTLRRRRATDFDTNRKRYGIVTQVEYRMSPQQKIRLSYNINSFRDREIRRQSIYDFSQQQEQRNTRNRLSAQDIYLFTLDGDIKLGRFAYDYHIAFADAVEEVNNRTEIFYQRPNDYSTVGETERFNLGPTAEFPLDDLALDRIVASPRINDEEVFNAGVNFRYELGPLAKNTLKWGGKYRGIDRFFGTYMATARPVDASTAPSLGSGGFGFAGQYFQDDAIRNLPLDGDFSGDLFASQGAYVAEEDIFAGFIMNTTVWSDKINTLVGARIEHTKSSFEQIATERVGNGEYTNVLPSFHFTYRRSSDRQLRVAYTEGISRPAYTSLIPFEQVSEDGLIITRGNTDLDPTLARSIDIAYEAYGDRLRVFTFGLFGKFLQDPIIQIGNTEIINDQEVTVIQPGNGGTARVLGAEFSLYRNLRTIFPGLKNFTLNANYTFTNSEANYSNFGAEEVPLVHSPRHTANLSLVYDNKTSGFSFVLAGVYRDYMFDRIEENNNIWLGRNIHVDASANYFLSNGIGFYVRLNNVTNQANTEYIGKPSDSSSRIYGEEKFGFWGSVGVRFELRRKAPEDIDEE